MALSATILYYIISLFSFAKKTVRDVKGRLERATTLDGFVSSIANSFGKKSQNLTKQEQYKARFQEKIKLEIGF